MLDVGKNSWSKKLLEQKIEKVSSTRNRRLRVRDYAGKLYFYSTHAASAKVRNHSTSPAVRHPLERVKFIVAGSETDVEDDGPPMTDCKSSSSAGPYAGVPVQDHGHSSGFALLHQGHGTRMDRTVSWVASELRWALDRRFVLQ